MANTTADKLTYLREAKELIRQAIITMGVNVPSDTPLKEYATKILSIQTGTDTSDATATASDLVLDKTAYAQGNKLVGTFDVMNSEIPEVGGTITETEDMVDDLLGDILGEVE